MQIALISITATRRVLATTMTSNPSDSDDRIMELTSDSEEEENTNSEGDESKLDDICVRDASCARLFQPTLYSVDGTPISLEKGLFEITGLLRIFFPVAFCSLPMPEHRGPWTYRATSV